MRPTEEIIKRIKKLCYSSYCAAQSGSSSDPAAGEILTILWVLNESSWTYEEIYRQGETLYKSGYKPE